jgi:hypothetical protein
MSQEMGQKRRSSMKTKSGVRAGTGGGQQWGGGGN